MFLSLSVVVFGQHHTHIVLFHISFRRINSDKNRLKTRYELVLPLNATPPQQNTMEKVFVRMTIMFDKFHILQQ